MTVVPVGTGDPGYVDNVREVDPVTVETENVPRLPILTLKGVTGNPTVFEYGSTSVPLPVVKFPDTVEFEIRVPTGIVEGHVERVIEDVVFEDTIYEPYVPTFTEYPVPANPTVFAMGTVSDVTVPVITFEIEYAMVVPRGTVAGIDGLIERAVPELFDDTEYVPKPPTDTL